MKVLTHKKPLLEGLDLVKDAVSKQSPLPILKDVKITAESDTLYLYTTNLTIGIKTWVNEADVIEPGTALCDVAKLLSIVRELPDSEIILTKDESNLVRVECDNVSFKLKSLNEEDFPAEINPSGQTTQTIGKEFLSGLMKVRHAASRELSRYNLNGVYLNEHIVATDGHRLSLATKSYPLPDMLIPVEFTNTILRLRRNGDQTYSLFKSDGTIFICSEDMALHCRLIDGEFPDYKAVIPETFERKATIDKTKLQQAIRRILLMSDKTNQIRFEFNADKVLLTSANPDAGEASEELQIRHDTEQPKESSFSIAFTGKYLLDVLEVLEEDTVTLQMNGSDQPLKIEEKDSLHIIMPVRLPSRLGWLRRNSLPPFGPASDSIQAGGNRPVVGEPPRSSKGPSKPKAEGICKGSTG